MMQTVAGHVQDGTQYIMWCNAWIVYNASQGEYFKTEIETGYYNNYSAVRNYYTYTTHFQSNPEGVGMYVSTEIYEDDFYRADNKVINYYYTDYAPYPYCDDICAVINLNTNYYQNGYTHPELWNTMYARDNY